MRCVLLDRCSIRIFWPADSDTHKIPRQHTFPPLVTASISTKGTAEVSLSSHRQRQDEVPLPPGCLWQLRCK